MERQRDVMMTPAGRAIPFFAGEAGQAEQRHEVVGRRNGADEVPVPVQRADVAATDDQRAAPAQRASLAPSLTW